MSMSRREFVIAGAALGAGAALPTTAHTAETPMAKQEAVLRISSQEGVMPGKSLEEKLDKMEKLGIEGLEIGSAIGREEALPKTLDGRKVKVSAVCMGSLGGRLVSSDKAAREKAAEDIKRHLTAAGAVGSTGCIFVPCFNGEQDNNDKALRAALAASDAGKAFEKAAGHRNAEIRKILVDMLGPIGEHALKCNTRILLEPLNRTEAWFLRQVADAAAIARDCKNMGVCVMGDFYHMAIEEPSLMGAFISGGQWLHHIHLASKSRVLPGQDKEPDEANYQSGFRGLKVIGYQDFMSFECGCRGDREAELPKCVAFLREQWDLAKV
ncbi:MAG: sugar phosphate isomerase/epimerase [Planctomycetes bacterium]|nr:sugar phosphate isomerase/epimerase [Planctomycetota bacterium]